MQTATSLSQPLDLTGFEREIAGQALEFHTGFEWSSFTGPTSIRNHRQGRLIVVALESFIAANIANGNSVTSYAALLGRVSAWLETDLYSDPLELATGHGRR